MTDTLDFPTIDDAALSRASAMPPAPKTEVATAAAGAIDLDKLDLSTLALSKFNPVRKQLADATRTLTGIAHDLSTQAKVDDAKSLRQRLINAPLADARKVSKGLKSKLKSVSDDVGAELEQIEAGFTEAAKLITPQIDAREAELAAEKAAREAKEAARRQEFEDKVAGIRNYLTLAQGLPSPRIEKGVTFLTAMVVGDEWAEFKPIAQKALDETLASLRALLAKVQAEEVAAAERERIAAENARLKAENERIVAELAAQRAELQRQAAAVEDSLVRSFMENSRRIEFDKVPYIEKAIRTYESVATDWENDERPRVKAAFLEGRLYLSERLAAAQRAEHAAEPPTEDPPQPTFALPHQAVEAALHYAERGMEILHSTAQKPVAHEPVSQDTGYTHIGVDLAGGHDQSVEVLVDVPPLTSEPTVISDRTGTLPILLAHIAKAFDTKFPSQPKPSIEWWAELKRLAREVAA